MLNRDVKVFHCFLLLDKKHRRRRPIQRSLTVHVFEDGTDTSDDVRLALELLRVLNDIADDNDAAAATAAAAADDSGNADADADAARAAVWREYRRQGLLARPNSFFSRSRVGSL